MFDLDAAVDQWVAAMVAGQPALADHANEIADHLLMHSRTEMEQGTSPEAALDLAIASLGTPDELAAEFRRSAGLMAKLRCIAAVDAGQSTREQLLMAAAWVTLSLLWAGAMIVFDDTMNWMLAGWVVTTFLPLTLLDAHLRRRAAHR
jgi:hypothetical protein